MNSETVLGLNQLSHVYVNDAGAKLAVDQIQLTVKKGEFISIVGPSGCGKTTILNMIAGMITPTSGELRVLGEAIDGPTAKLGYMQQQDYLFPWRTIRDNVAIGLEINRLKSAENLQKIDHLLSELGLGEDGLKFPHQLSGGMRQRVALARTLVTDPEVLLLDEPFSALDLYIKMQLEELVQTTLDRLGKTAVLVTHDLQEAVAISDRVVILESNPGRIRKIMTIPRELREAGPIEARKHPLYQRLFEEVWLEFKEQITEGGE